MIRRISLEIEDLFDKKEVKDVLKNHLNISQDIISSLKKSDDGILVNGKKVYVTHKLNQGDKLEITVADERSDIKETKMPLDILFEDEDIIVINKPRNLPTHPSLKHYEDTLANGLMCYFKGEKFTFRAITRLDRDTSGVVLVAKNPLSASVLNDAMKNGEIKKEYIALVNGKPKEKSGRISAPIKRKAESVILRCVAEDGKEAITDYETIVSKNGLSLVKLKPITGRTHQLRVHLSYIGTPIFGDDLYGAPQKDEAVRLHCRKIEFLHPIAKTKLNIEADMPLDMGI